MAKLKFDRSVNIILNGDEQINVPKNEVWNGTLSGGSANINRISFFKPIYNGNTFVGTQKIILGGGTEISNGQETGRKLTFTGIAFKIIP